MDAPEVDAEATDYVYGNPKRSFTHRLGKILSPAIVSRMGAKSNRVGVRERSRNGSYADIRISAIYRDYVIINKPDLNTSNNDIPREVGVRLHAKPRCTLRGAGDTHLLRFAGQAEAEHPLYNCLHLSMCRNCSTSWLIPKILVNNPFPARRLIRIGE